MLKMKKHCEQCEADTKETQSAFICSYECTFCPTCAEEMDHVCPNCSGELVLRPRRNRKPIEVGLAQIRKKLLGD
ncbi:MAG: DUF1272 domain-containing protein [Oleiphilaceae bacterium]|nr:DUF1272 domain-containing protein [Oleiphilaceae bacterium]